MALVLPDARDLPVTEGPPDQVEPVGQTLSGPRPDTVPRHLARRAQRRRHALRALVIRRALPAVSPDAVIRAAQGLLGTGESPAGSNCNAITHRFGLGCCAWCDETVFTAWFNAGFNDGHGNFAMAGLRTDYALGDAYVPNTMRRFQAAGRFHANPIPGAAGVHFWGGGEGNSHIVIYCKDVDAGTVLNIEGNHNNVCEYVRRPKADSTRAGYCHPVYAAQPEEDDMFADPDRQILHQIADWFSHDFPGAGEPNAYNASIENYRRIKGLELDVERLVFIAHGTGLYVTNGLQKRWVPTMDDYHALINTGVLRDGNMIKYEGDIFDAIPFVPGGEDPDHRHVTTGLKAHLRRNRHLLVDARPAAVDAPPRRARPLRARGRHS